jgi:hypothetical protein
MRAKSVFTFRGDNLSEYQKAIALCMEISKRSSFGPGVKFGPVDDKTVIKTGLMIYGDDTQNVWSFQREFEIAAGSKKLQLVRA